MAHPEEPPGTLNGAPGEQSTLAAADAPLPRAIMRMLALLGATVVACFLAYVIANVAGPWFPSAQRLDWTAGELAVTRGHGTVRGNELVAMPDATGLVIVSLATRFASRQYPVVSWEAQGVPPNAEARLLWRSDYAPAKMSALRVSVASGRLLPVEAYRDPNWLGNVLGLAIAIQGAPAEGVRIRAVSASPMGVPQIVRDRLRDWLTFEAWDGASINTIVGGVDGQELPLPLVLFVALVLACGIAVGVMYRGHRLAGVPALLAIAFMLAWSFSDVRWTANLLRQARATVAQLGGKTLEDRHRAAADGAVYAFIEHVRAKLPPTPVRIVVAAETSYFRGRAAYHLYPNNVYFEPRENTLPKPEQLHPGDYMVVYQRRGVQFDVKQGLLRWDGNAPVRAEVVHVEPGAAAFRLL